ncbi:MAG: hypothetical protein JST51_01475 [Armatimonadetes bacterium]|nr:hypothetical protein [Armatimonadota bacterium]
MKDKTGVNTTDLKKDAVETKQPPKSQCFGEGTPATGVTGKDGFSDHLKARGLGKPCDCAQGKEKPANG